MENARPGKRTYIRVSSGTRTHDSSARSVQDVSALDRAALIMGNGGNALI